MLKDENNDIARFYTGLIQSEGVPAGVVVEIPVSNRCVNFPGALKNQNWCIREVSDLVFVRSGGG